MEKGCEGIARRYVFGSRSLSRDIGLIQNRNPLGGQQNALFLNDLKSAARTRCTSRGRGAPLGLLRYGALIFFINFDSRSRQFTYPSRQRPPPPSLPLALPSCVRQWYLGRIPLQLTSWFLKRLFPQLTIIERFFLIGTSSGISAIIMTCFFVSGTFIYYYHLLSWLIWNARSHFSS